jgi:hypothetical protein
LRKRESEKHIKENRWQFLVAFQVRSINELLVIQQGSRFAELSLHSAPKTKALKSHKTTTETSFIAFCNIIVMMSACELDATVSPAKVTRRVSFRDDDLIDEISSNVIINPNDHDGSSASEPSPSWYTDEDFARWRSEATTLVANFLSRKNMKTVVPHSGTESQQQQDDSVVCLRGLEYVLNGETNGANSFTVDKVLIAQRRQRNRGLCNEEEIAALYSNISSSSQREAIERAQKDSEDVQRDHHETSKKSASPSRSNSINVFLNQKWESARPKRRRDSRSKVLGIFRRNKRNPKDNPLEKQLPQ